MRISHCLAAGLGLALLSSASAGAAPQRVRHRIVASHPAHDRARDRSKLQTASHAGARGAARLEEPNDRILDRMLVQQQKVLARLAKVASRPAGKRAPASAAQAVAAPRSPLRPQGNDVGPLRQELSDVTEQLWGNASPDLALRPQPQSPSAVEPKRVTLKLPDIGEPGGVDLQLPVNPATAGEPAFIDARSADRPGASSSVADAIGYLIATATPGATMLRQGTALAISRLHPDFSIRLAEAVKRARAAGLAEAGVSSAYRPPAFGVGGFADKFDSLHSYGLAADIAGIGGAGSASAHLWQAIVEEVGLYLVYGADNRAEFNHTQLIPEKRAPLDLRETITPSAPKDLREMWLASGIDDHVDDATAATAMALAVREPDDDDEITPPAPPATTDAAAAPRRVASARHRPAEHGMKLSKRSKEAKLAKLPKLSKMSKHAGHAAPAHTRVSAAPQHAGARHKAG
jgi:hypothetical protein